MSIHKSHLLPSLTLLILVSVSIACKTVRSDQNSKSSEVQGAPSAHPIVAARVAISTEHPLSGVGNTRDMATACRLTRNEVASMHKQGIYYAAVKGRFYQGPEGAYCGQKFKLSVGGACFQNHNKNCLEPEGHGTFDQAAQKTGKQYTGNKSITIFIADICGSCIDDALHIDITGDAFLPGGPLHGVKEYFKQNRIANKSGKTIEENNLFIEKIEAISDCVDFVQLMNPLAPIWGIPSGPCAKMPTGPTVPLIMPFQGG